MSQPDQRPFSIQLSAAPRSVERALDQRPLELFKKPIFPRQVLGLLIVSKQLIQQFRCNRRVGRHVMT